MGRARGAGPGPTMGSSSVSAAAEPTAPFCGSSILLYSLSVFWKENSELKKFGDFDFVIQSYKLNWFTSTTMRASSSLLDCCCTWLSFKLQIVQSSNDK